MNAKDLIKAGQLSAARNALIETVKSSPTDLNSRTLLFQVLAFCGEWQKARRHLEIIANQDLTRETGVQVYLNLVGAEAQRLEVFHYQKQPSFLPGAPVYNELYEFVRQKLADKEYDEAKSILNQIKDQLPKISGTLNGNPFVGFSDTDSQLSFFLEAFVHEHYVWLPLESIRELSIPVPKTFFDLLWISAQITTWEGLALNCYLPVLYPESFLNEDDRMKLGRMTDWTNINGGFLRGMGQHVFQVGEDEVGILEIREMIFKFPESEKKDETEHRR
jgi:type VI secretion system protein ImpE